MSAKSSKSTKNSNKSGRIKYGFALNFPDKPFTIRNLEHMKKGKVKYITLYTRVKNALKEGALVIAGEKASRPNIRGRRQTVYQRVDAKTPVISVAAPAAAAPAAS